MSRNFGLPMLVAITALATLPLLRQPGRAGSREHHPPRRYRLALEEGFEHRYRRARFRLPLAKTTYVFYELDQLEPGDEILIKDQKDEEYPFRVYDRITVRPEDFWITCPVPDKTVIPLQTCTPSPPSRIASSSEESW